MATKEAQRAGGKSGMWTGAIVIGIIAGLAGLMSAVNAIMTGGVGATFEVHGATQVIASGWSALVFAVIARPLFLVAALLGRVRQEAQRPPRSEKPQPLV